MVDWLFYWGCKVTLRVRASPFTRTSNTTPPLGANSGRNMRGMLIIYANFSNRCTRWWCRMSSSATCHRRPSATQAASTRFRSSGSRRATPPSPTRTYTSRFCAPCRRTTIRRMSGWRCWATSATQRWVRLFRHKHNRNDCARGFVCQSTGAN